MFPKNKVEDYFTDLFSRVGLGHIFLTSAPGWRAGGHELEKGATKATSENNEWNNLLYF